MRVNLLYQTGVHTESEYPDRNPADDQNPASDNHAASLPVVTILPGEGREYPGGSCLPFLFAGAVDIGAALQNRMEIAFRPVLGLVKAAGYPLCFLMVSTGMLLVMLGMRKRGIDMIKWAAVGYIGLQFVPVIMSLIRQVADAMGS